MSALWSAQDVAGYLGVPINTLYDWRAKGYGPPAGLVGKYLRYESADVVEWFRLRKTPAA